MKLHFGRLPFWLSSTWVVFHFGHLPFWSSSILVVFHFGCVPFLLSSIMIVFHFGLIPFWSSSILVVFRFGLLPFWSYSILIVFHFGCPPFWSSSILVVFLLGCLPFIFLQKSSSWVEIRWHAKDELSRYLGYRFILVRVIIICYPLVSYGGKTKSTNLSWVRVGLGWVGLEFDKNFFLPPKLAELYFFHFIYVHSIPIYLFGTMRPYIG